MPKEEEEKEGGEGRNPPIYYTSLYILFFKIRLLWPDQKKHRKKTRFHKIKKN